MKFLNLNTKNYENLCSNCKACEEACLTHLFYKEDLKAEYEFLSTPLNCRFCKEKFCLLSCPSGAIKESSNGIFINFFQEKCIGCLSCVMVCPLGLFVKTTEEKVTFKCLHCQDKEIPPCLTKCPDNFIKWEEVS